MMLRRANHWKTLQAFALFFDFYLRRSSAQPTIKQGLIDLHRIFREMAGDDFYELRESDSESIDGNDTIGRMKGVEVQGTF